MPANGRYLLDTNIVTALFAGEASVIEHLSAADEVFLPVPVLGELYYGARKSARATATLARLDEFAASVTVIAPTGSGFEASRSSAKTSKRSIKRWPLIGPEGLKKLSPNMLGNRVSRSSRFRVSPVKIESHSLPEQ